MNKKDVISTIVFAVLVLGIFVACLLKPEGAFSESERRALAAKPELSAEAVMSGEFMQGFEEYAADQFPMRDKLRSLKALFTTKVLGKMDNNGIFMADGHISKLEYPANDEMTKYAAERFDYLYNTYMKDKNMNIYLSLIPDKNYFIAEKNGYPAIDYDKFIEDFRARVPYMEYIDLLPQLSAEDYYRTDSHWKQENIGDIAELLVRSMGGVPAAAEYKINTLDNPFKGVYLGQAALPAEPDTIRYLTNAVIDGCKVTYFDTGVPRPGDMYDMDKAYGKDPYEMFLSGTMPLVTIENPGSGTDKELILFRDSYGSSIAPLLAQSYKKITVVDIRYIQSGFLKGFIEFDNQDVLFLYSTTLLNNSIAMR